MGRATVCLASLLLVVTFLFVFATTESLTAVQTDHATTKSRSSPPVHCCKPEEEAVARPVQPAGGLVDLASAEEQGQKPDSHRSNKKKIHDDDDDDNDDGDDGDNNDDNDDGNDNDDNDNDRSHSDHDSDRDDDDDNSKGRKKKKPSAPEKKGVPGGNR